ncbi:hypothetical protein BU16DRAFT_613712 [Lophium mytilinum]|uniref:Uncharacterized protein n=1 Tax=Lophium mytilinum TaxID=390894 RepID=A0A6A6RDR5_9PEZI|nr:hypothetical protein BU16DRAFT_613712 [Lophium mytilinum]
MYTLHHRIYIAVSLASFATALNIAHATATPTTLQGYSADGFTPKPTSSPLLYTCHNGDVCGYNSEISWCGCCKGYSAGVATGCNVVTSCVGYGDLSSCSADPACSTDSEVLACTDTALPYCATDALDMNGDSYATMSCAASAYTSYWELDATLVAPSSAVDSATAAVITKSPTTAAATAAGKTPASSTTSTGGAAAKTGAVVMGAAGGMVALVMLFA